MVRSAKIYGVLSTINSWVFLKRENGGQLWMTNPFPCHILDPFSIMEALYYISALGAKDGHLAETNDAGNVIKVMLANYKSPCAARSVFNVAIKGDEVYYPPGPSTDATIIGIDSKSHVCPCGLIHRILLEPWKGHNCLGNSTFIANWFPGNLVVVAKVWDSYKESSQRRDHEFMIYTRLRSLWGKLVPQVICVADIDFCYGIILEEIKVLLRRNFISLTSNRARRSVQKT